MDVSKDFKYSRIGSGEIKIEKYIGTATSANIPSHIDNSVFFIGHLSPSLKISSGHCYIYNAVII